MQNIDYSPNYLPVKLLIIPDITNNGASEVAVFGKNLTSQTQKAQVKDGRNKKLIGNVFFNKNFE